MHVGHTETAVVTGKPLELGGSLGRREATGRGVSIATRESAKHLGFDIHGARVAVQGFGNVGSISAELLADPRREDRGDLGLEGRRPQRERASTSPGSRSMSGRTSPSTASQAASGSPTSNCSRSTSTCSSRPRSKTRSPMANAPGIRAKVVVEGANGPTTPDAHRHLHERGRVGDSRHPGQQRGRDGVVLRMGAGPLRLLLDGKGSQRAARGQDVRGVPRRAPDVAEAPGRHADRRLHRGHRRVATRHASCAGCTPDSLAADASRTKASALRP